MQNKPPNPNSGDDQPSQSMGRGMYAVAWLFGLALLTMFFSGHEKRKVNPNQNPDTSMQNGVAEVVLQQNRQGHYVTNGTINGHKVVFLLDTGATDVSIPAHIADDIGLKRGRGVQVSTANGTIKVYQSWLQEVGIGEILLTNVDANINPGMKDDFILLGMSALKHLEFAQRGRTLTLKTYQ